MITRSAERIYSLGLLVDIPLGEGRCFQIEDDTVAVYRTREGEIFATQAVCPHRAGPLADGLVGPRQVVCPLHSYAFDLTTGEPQGGDCPALKTYRVAVADTGEVLLWDDESNRRKAGDP